MERNHGGKFLRSWRTFLMILTSMWMSLPWGKRMTTMSSFPMAENIGAFPTNLLKGLRGKHSERTISGVSLGYDDEYSVRFTDCSMTSNMKSKTFLREYDDINDSTGVKQVIVGAI